MWKVTSGQSLVSFHWDDEFVVYNSLSGDTHLLGSVAMHLLLSLRELGPMDELGLLEAVRAVLEPQQALFEPEELAIILGDLQSLALVERT